MRDGNYGAGPDGARTDPEEGPSVCGRAAPPLVPARVEGPGRAAARVPGGTELGGRDRPLLPDALGGRIPIPSGSPLVGKSVPEARLAVSLGVSLNCGAHYMRPLAGRGICTKSFLWRGFCLRSLWGVISVSLLSRGGLLVWGSFWEACVWDAFEEISVWDLQTEKGFLCLGLIWVCQPKRNKTFLFSEAFFSLDSFTLLFLV